jgi:hypothetical protein
MCVFSLYRDTLLGTNCSKEQYSLDALYSSDDILTTVVVNARPFRVDAHTSRGSPLDLDGLPDRSALRVHTYYNIFAD